MANPDETCDGVAQNDMGICRMDIVDSELGYLGYDSTESYGVTWKVIKRRVFGVFSSGARSMHAWAFHEGEEITCFFPCVVGLNASRTGPAFLWTKVLGIYVE